MAKVAAIAERRTVFVGQSYLDTYTGADRLAARTLAGLGIGWTDYPARGGYGWGANPDGTAGGLLADIGNRLRRVTRPGHADDLWMIGGAGDMVNPAPAGQQSGAVAFARALTYAAAARALGYGRVGCAQLPVFDATLYPVEAARVADYNALVRAEAANPAGAFDGTVDLGTWPLTNGLDRRYYIFDSVHWTPEGVARAADLLRPAVLRMRALP